MSITTGTFGLWLSERGPPIPPSLIDQAIRAPVYNAVKPPRPTEGQPFFSGSGIKDFIVGETALKLIDEVFAVGMVPINEENRRGGEVGVRWLSALTDGVTIIHLAEES